MKNDYHYYLLKKITKIYLPILFVVFSFSNTYADDHVMKLGILYDHFNTGFDAEKMIFQDSCDGISLWSASATYNTGDEVQYGGNKYRANWWTRDENPETNSGANGSGLPWFLVGPCGTDQPITVSITSPINGAIFDQGDTINVTANANDPDGTISQVEFFEGGNSLGADTTSPYSINWSNGGSGERIITATATNTSGQTATSSSITITINPVGPQPPVVAITSPTNNANFIVGANINITASASDIDGTITKVEFFHDTTKLGEDSTAPYSFNWSGATEGNYSLTAVVTDNDGLTGTSSPVSIRVRTNDGSTDLPDRVIVGYWHNFDNGSGFIRPENVSSKFDVVNISFAEPVSGSTSLIDFTPDATNITDADFRTGIQTLQSRGQEVVISIGGANGLVQLNTIAERDEFVSSMISIIEEYGFDGMDIDFEGQSLSLDLGDDDFRNPTTPRIVNLISAINTIYDHFGNNFILTMAPETFFVQLGYSFYGGISAAADRRSGAYLPVIHALRDRLTFLQVQYYNSGSITALDDQFYAMGNADFYVALVDMLLKGFPITGDTSKFFPALRQDQVLIGLPASFSAGGGFAPPAEVHKALDYLIKGISFGGNYTLTQTYPDLRGLMTWSVNWDAFNNFEFSDEHRAYLDALDGINPLPTVAVTSPTNNSNFVLGDVINITADASDNGSVTQVEFFVDGISIGVDTVSPYSVNWSSEVGTHTISAIATDNEGTIGNSGTISIEVISDSPNELPVVSITSPTSGATFDQGTAISIAANATDSDGAITQVEFFADGVSIGIDTSSPYSIAWNNATASAHTISARATDNLSGIGISSEITITVNPVIGGSCAGIPIWSATQVYNGGDEVQFNNNKYQANWWTQGDNPETNSGATGSGLPWTLVSPCSDDPDQNPNVNITSPSAGSTFSLNTAIEITANATDDGAITQVEFFADGQSLGVDTTNPYSISWSNGTEGNHSLTAVAKDNTGKTGTSSAVNIIIDPITNPLSVSITAPSNGATFTIGDAITLSATASDADGSVVLVEFFNGSTKLGEDTTAPYQITWSSGNLGNHSLTARATDNVGDQATSSVVNISITDGPPPPSDLAKHIMVGYWHNFDNGAAVLKLREVSEDWDVVNIAFAEPATFGEADLAFTPSSDVTTEAEFREDVRFLQSRGQKVLISIGGANGRIELLTSADAQTYANAMISIIEDYGFDGMDIDLEGTSLGLSTGDNDFRNPTSPKIVNFISGTRTILNHFGSDFVLSAAPETAFVQGGHSTYVGSFGAYLPVIYEFRDELDYIHVQDYNSGCMLGLDGVCYSQGTADFHVAMTEMLLQGFSVAGHSVSFPALRQDQVAFGIPASPQAAGGGYTTPDDVKKAMDYLIKGVSFGGNYTLVNSAGYPNLRGLMTWSINWDVFYNQEFSSNYRPYFDALLGGSKSNDDVLNQKEVFTAFPNPVKTNANFRFDLQGKEHVSLTMYNLLGRKIKVLTNETLNKGTHEYQLDMSAYAKGIYLLQLKTVGKTRNIKILKN